MAVGEIILIIVLYNVFGLVAFLPIASMFTRAYGFEFINPIWLYKHTSVNVFGAIFLSIVFNLMCPIIAIIYWLYKLCTVGRE